MSNRLLQSHSTEATDRRQHAPVGVGVEPNLRRFARIVGNRAARRALVPTGGALSSPALIARVAWRDEAAFKKTKSELTTEQSAGVTAAVASPAAKPDSVKTWVEARVKVEMDYATTLSGLSALAQTKAAETWEANKTKILAKDENATKNPDDVKRDWIASTVPTMAAAERRKLDNKVKVSVGNRIGELKGMMRSTTRTAFCQATGALVATASTTLNQRHPTRLVRDSGARIARSVGRTDGLLLVITTRTS